MPNLSTNLSGYGDITAVSIVTTGDVTVGDDIVLTGELNGWYFYSGSADPTSGGGVAHTEPAVYRRTGTNQVWLSTGAGATSWVRLVALAETNPSFTGLTIVGTTTPLIVDVATSETNFNSPAEITSNQTDYAIAGSAANLVRFSRYRLTSDAARTINSITAPTGGHRLVFTIHNINTDTARTITLLHDDGATGTAANRILCPNNANYVIRANGAARLWYDSTSSRYRVEDI